VLANASCEPSALQLAASSSPWLLVTYSFWTENGLVPDTQPTLAQYGAVVTREIYRVLFLRSLAISSIVTLATVALGYPMAYFIAFRVRRGKFLWLLLLSIPFWTSYLLRVFAWKVILGYNGVINSALSGLHLVSGTQYVLALDPGGTKSTYVGAETSGEMSFFVDYQP